MKWKKLTGFITDTGIFSKLSMETDLWFFFFFFNWKRSFLFFLGLSFSKSLIHTHTYVLAKMLQLCPTLCNPMDYSLPGSSVHGMLLQARILEWVAMPSSRGSSALRDWTLSLMFPALAGGSFTTSATWEARACVCVCVCVHIFLKQHLDPILGTDERIRS